MKQYSYYDAYHRQEEIPDDDPPASLAEQERGISFVFFYCPGLGALFLVGGDHGGSRLEQDLSGTVGCQYQRQQEFFLVRVHTKK